MTGKNKGGRGQNRSPRSALFPRPRDVAVVGVIAVVARKKIPPGYRSARYQTARHLLESQLPSFPARSPPFMGRAAR